MEKLLCGIKISDSVKEEMYSVRQDGLVEFTLPTRFIEEPVDDYIISIDDYEELLDIQKEQTEEFYGSINSIVAEYRKNLGVPYRIDVKLSGWKKKITCKLKRYGDEYVGIIKVPIYLQYCPEELVAKVLTYKLYLLDVKYEIAVKKKGAILNVSLDDSSQKDSEGRRIYRISNSVCYEIHSEEVDNFGIQADYNQASSEIRDILKDVNFRYL